MASPRPHDRRCAIAVCVSAAVTVLVCAALLSIAVIAPAPLAVLPFVILICTCSPVFATWQLSHSVELLRRRSFGPGALEELRGELARLPETNHPLGL